MNANMQFGRGSLVAGPTWDPGEEPNFLFIVGHSGGCKYVRVGGDASVTDTCLRRLYGVLCELHCRFPQGSCNIDINFPELFVDGAKRASGIQINDVMGVTIGPGGCVREPTGCIICHLA